MSGHRTRTRLIHAGRLRPRIAGAIATPIFQSSTFEDARVPAGYDAVRYMRLSNLPNHQVLHDRLADLEGAERALVTASGMAAISAALLTVVGNGDHVLFQDCLYGGTHNFITDDLAAFGVEFDFVSGDTRQDWEAKLRPNTRAVYVETLTNPLLQVLDFEVVVGLAREHGLVSLIDNTTATPLYFRPIEHGFDLALQSATKYLNGHSDIVAGVVAGRGDLVEKVHHRLNHLGGSLDAHAAYLLQRGLATLALRLPAQTESTLRLAQALESHAAIRRVHYPGLRSHPHHGRAERYLDGCGALFSFELAGGSTAAEAMLDRLELAARAPSFGGVETLVTLPAETSHSGMDPQARRAAGIADDLVRVAVGLEHPDDLCEDFVRALD